MTATQQDSVPETEEIIKVNANTRLYDLLLTLSKKSSAMLTGDMVATVVGVSEPNGAKAVMKAAAVLYKMMEAADREIEYYLPKQGDFYLPTMNEIRESISLSKWGAPWNNVKANLTASHLTHVLHTGQRLKDISPECLLKTSNLQSILDAVEELRQTIEELDISEVAKHKLRQRCGNLGQAVEEYRFWGVDGIEVSFEAVKGAMLPLVQRDERGTPTLSWLKIGRIALTISTMLGLANTGYKNAHDSFLLLDSAVHAVETYTGPTIEAIERKLSS